MPFYVILILCLFGGLTIVFLATWLTTTRGNTISEILNSQKFKDAESIKLEIADKVKISSTIPVVALYIIGAFVAVGLPSMIYWINSKDVTSFTLSGNVIKDQHKRVFMRPKGYVHRGKWSFRHSRLRVEEDSDYQHRKR